MDNSPPQQPAAPVDLELRVTTPWGSGGQSFRFMVSSPSGALPYHQEIVVGPPIHNPDTFQERWLDQIGKLRVGKDIDGEPILGQEVAVELETLGHDLFKSVFPRQMRTIYREVRDRVSTLLITSDEPWIPWEILRPFELDDDDFFCAKFRMGRWLAGEAALAPQKRVARVLGFEGYSDLEASNQELSWLGQLVGAVPGVVGDFLPQATFQEVISQLSQGRFDLIHYAGHGQHHLTVPSESGVVLKDRAFRARQLPPGLEFKLRQERPLVFFNTCEVGRLSRSLTDIDGWAARWVKRCGCSAFLGPMWAVGDSAALFFSQIFYRELAQGRTLGAAVFQARQELRARDSQGLTWLAYSLYGHPNATIQFGPDVPFEQGTENQGSAGSQKLPGSSQEFTTSGELFRRCITDSNTSAEFKTPKSASPIQKTSSILTSRSRGSLYIKIASGLLGVLGILGVGLNWPIFNEPSSVDEVPAKKSAPADMKPEPESLTLEPEKGPLGDLTSNPEASIKKEATKPAPSQQEAAGSAPPQGPSKLESLTPFSTIVPGRVVIVGLDRQSMHPDLDVTDAIDAYLSSDIPKIATMTPSIKDVDFVKRLANGNLSALPKDGSAPWGAEYMVISTSSLKKLPHRNLTALALTLKSKLINVSSSTVEVSTNETQSGIGPSVSSAIAQASERCLREISKTLKGEEDDSN